MTLVELAAIECIKCPFFENIDDVDDSVDLDDAMTSRQMAIRLMVACHKTTQLLWCARDSVIDSFSCGPRFDPLNVQIKIFMKRHSCWLLIFGPQLKMVFKTR